MKIEKINENQIRCTLTREELAERQMKLSELAYGTDKAKLLFRDMMQQAAYEYGFEAEDIPLMIEAIPLSSDSIILIITKVEYPEELDTRFSQFSEPDPSDLFEDLYGAGSQILPPQGADDVLGIYKKMQEERSKAAPSTEKENTADQKTSDHTPPITVATEITRLYAFRDLEELVRLAHVLDGFYTGKSRLYRRDGAKSYDLLVRKGEQSPENFNKVCNILSEYAKQQNYTQGTEAFYDEHYRVILREDALQTLAKL
jgi:adapter protein MecA 1/2